MAYMQTHIHFNRQIQYLDLFQEILNISTFLSKFYLVNLLYIYRPLFLPFKHSSPTAAAICLSTNFSPVVNTSTVNCQLARFNKKDTRGFKFIHEEPLMGLYTILF